VNIGPFIMGKITREIWGGFPILILRKGELFSRFFEIFRIKTPVFAPSFRFLIF
jgi:hypothetical protein